MVVPGPDLLIARLLSGIDPRGPPNASGIQKKTKLQLTPPQCLGPYKSSV